MVPPPGNTLAQQLAVLLLSQSKHSYSRVLLLFFGLSPTIPHVHIHPVPSKKKKRIMQSTQLSNRKYERSQRVLLSSGTRESLGHGNSNKSNWTIELNRMIAAGGRALSKRLSGKPLKCHKHCGRPTARHLFEGHPGQVGTWLGQGVPVARGYQTISPAGCVSFVGSSE